MHVETRYQTSRARHQLAVLQVLMFALHIQSNAFFHVHQGAGQKQHLYPLHAAKRWKLKPSLSRRSDFRPFQKNMKKGKKKKKKKKKKKLFTAFPQKLPRMCGSTWHNPFRAEEAKSISSLEHVRKSDLVWHEFRYHACTSASSPNFEDRMAKIQ